MSEFNPKSILGQAETELDEAQSLAGLEEVLRRYLGDKGLIRSFFKEISSLSEKERKGRGSALNQLRQEITDLAGLRKKELGKGLSEKTLREETESLDLKLPKIGHLHPITQTVRMMNKIFTEMGYSVMDGPEIETDEYNFQRLNVPKNHPARDMQDTIYIEEPNYLLRTQTSSIEARILANYKPPLKVVCPGKSYRNEKVNKSNHFILHQYQGLVVLESVSLKDLFGTFTHLFQKMYGPDVKVRYRNKYYPEVEPGAGPDMQCFNCQGKGCSLCKNVGWIEMGGSGIVHPNVLKMAGIDPRKWKGFAFGLGLDRWTMAKYKIADIRTLLGGDLAYKYYENENTLY